MTRRLRTESPALLSFRGPDAVRYLNGQLTQDVRELGNTALPSCVTDAKGRLQFLVSVFRGPEEDEIRIAGDRGRAGDLRARLERYLIADDVEVEDLSGQWLRVHAEGPMDGAAMARDAGGIFGSGIDHWFSPDAEPAGEVISDAEAESLRIAAGIPAWGRELEEGMLPPEAGLDRTAVSYHKGCYIGQEVLSRIKSIGRVNRRLARLMTSATGPTSLQSAGRECGTLTSVAPAASEDGTRPALGYVKKTAYEETVFDSPEGHRTRLLGWA